MSEQRDGDVVRTLQGAGTVMDGDTILARVQYRIEVRRGYLSDVSPLGTEDVPTLERAQGTLTPIGPNDIVPAQSKELALVLEDGRRMQFYVTEAGDGYYAIRVMT